MKNAGNQTVDVNPWLQNIWHSKRYRQYFSKYLLFVFTRRKNLILEQHV